MAISKTVLAAQTPIVGIKGETTFGVGLDDTGTDTTAYRQLPVMQANRPTFEIIRESRLLSGQGSMKHAADTFSTPKGGTVTMPFDFWATPKLLPQFLALVGQQHSESASTLHQTVFDSTSNYTVLGDTISGGLPQSVNISYYPKAAHGIKVCGAMVSDLTLAISSGSNGNNLSMSGNFYSGHSNHLSTSTTIEQTVDTTLWVAPETTYFNLGNLLTRTLEVEGALQDMVMKDFSLNIANGAVRGGSDANGNAETINLPEFTITGSMSVKYDAEIDYSSGTNVLEDFLDGDTLSLQLIWGAGNDAAGEMQIDAEIQYTGLPDQDISESGIFHTLPFECVFNKGVAEALKIQVFNGESIAVW
mgnify:CR=1 FL=1